MVLGQAARIAEFPPACARNIPVTLAQPFGAPIGYAYPKEQIYVASLGIKISDREQIVNDPSGGNQQNVVIAKWLATEPRILILDEPTRGIGVTAKAEVHRVISALADKGVSILLISSELPEILALSGRVLIMHEGRSKAILDKAEASQETIMSAALVPGVSREVA